MSIQTLRSSGLLSFAPDSPPLDLRRLNVLIGPNGSGKSNLIEAIELLAATPRDLAATIRDGGGPGEWLWKGSAGGRAEIEAVLEGAPTGRPLRYRIQLDAVQSRVEITDEAIEETKPAPGKPPGSDVFFYYRFQQGNPVINVADGRPRHLQRENLRPDQSVLAQRKDPDLYPEVTWVGERLGNFHTFREWSFGRYVALRQPQPADLPEDRLLADSRNLALVLNQIEHDSGGARLRALMRRFYPRFDRLSTRISGGQYSSIFTSKASRHRFRRLVFPTARFASSRWRRLCSPAIRRRCCASRNRSWASIRTHCRCSASCLSKHRRKRSSSSRRTPMRSSRR